MIIQSLPILSLLICTVKQQFDLAFYFPQDLKPLQNKVWRSSWSC